MEDFKWNRLGLLDNHVQVLKKQIEVLSQELCSTVAEREQLLDELGMVRWPGGDEDVIFFRNLPGTLDKKKASMKLQPSTRISPKLLLTDFCSDSNGNNEQHQSGHFDTRSKYVHRRGQSWAGWDKKDACDWQLGTDSGNGRRDRRKILRNRSMDDSIGMDSLPFGGDLPTHRGPPPTLDILLGEAEGLGGSLASTKSFPTPRVKLPSFSAMLPPIKEADPDSDEATVVEELKMPESVLSNNVQSVNGMIHGGTPDGEALGSPRGRENVDAVVESGAPKLWLSNTAFHSPIDQGCPQVEEEVAPVYGDHQHPLVPMRTTHMALVERANRATRLSKELFQARFALHDSHSQLEYLTKKMMLYRTNFQNEVSRHQEEANQLRTKLNEAITSRFMMFCKLSECQQKVQQLENQLARSFMSRSHTVEDENFDSNRRTNRRGNVLDTVNGFESHRNQRRSRGSSVDISSDGSQKSGQTARTDRGDPLQRRLTETMRRLLDAQNRGDRLQQRVRELESHQKRSGESKSPWSIGSKPGVVLRRMSVPSVRETSELKQARAELKRTSNQLRRKEEELDTANRLLRKKEQDISKLKADLKDARHLKLPKWR